MVLILIIIFKCQAPHPCNTYSVHTYNLTFQDQHSKHNNITFTRQNDYDRVVIEIPDSEDHGVVLQRNRVYLVTIVAISEVGSTVSGEITVCKLVKFTYTSL